MLGTSDCHSGHTSIIQEKRRGTAPREDNSSAIPEIDQIYVCASVAKVTHPSTMASWPGYSAGLTLDVLDTWGPLVSFVFTLYFSSIVQRFGSVYDLVMHLGAASLIAGIIFVILVMRRPNGAPLILMRHFAALRACLAYGVIAWLFVETTSGPNEHHRVPLIKVLWFL